MRRLILCTAWLVCLVLTSGVSAQTYRTSVIARDLERPTGITVSLFRQLYFTELPTPGVSGPNGGTNTVNQLRANRRVRVLTEGEPEPTNLSANLFGDIYWTCKSAGVILTLERRATEASLVVGGLNNPSGIAASPLGFAQFFTEVPTPGTSGANGGENKVSVFIEGIGRTIVLDQGDPQPTDVAVDLFGNIYWTCTSAGVIVRLSGGEVEVIARDLKRPYGLASDLLGNLYFTEVPTPGVSGADGGENRVSKLNVGTGEITLIDLGDPDPIDVTVEPFGTTVYWTCRSAGVIVEAKLQRRRR